MAIRRNVGFDVFNVRLLTGLDRLLRAKRRYQGDLSASINDALLAVNLNTVKLIALQGKKKQTARETQVVILRRLIRGLHRIAKARGCSINQLVNSGLMAYYSKRGSGKLGGSSRPPRQSTEANYDKMSAAERQQLFEALGTLTGIREGPTGKFSDGTYFEYDSALETTVEVRRSGERFPVTLVRGKLQRESETTVAHRTARSGYFALRELKPALIVIAGPLGAGKTTFYEAHLKEAFPDLVPPIAHKRDEMLRARRSFAVEDWTVDLELLENARQAGYITKVFFISTEDPNLNVGRVLLRMSQSGQGVPLTTIPESYEEAMRSLPEARKHADDLLVYDNAENGRGHRLVARFIGGELVKTSQTAPDWLKEIFGRELHTKVKHQEKSGRAR